MNTRKKYRNFGANMNKLDNCNCCFRYRMVDKTGICFDCWKDYKL